MATSAREYRQHSRESIVTLPEHHATWPLFIGILGAFRVLRAGQPVSLRGEKTETLLGHLALHHADGVRRATLLAALWPDSAAALAGEALYSRVHALHRLLGAAIGGLAPVVQLDGHYRLNQAAGVGVDAACFDDWATTGDRLASAGHTVEAAAMYQDAVELYHGDLCVQMDDLHAVVERERLRARYLTLVALLGTHAFKRGDHAVCLAYAQRMLSHDPCREDAHRLVMRCHVRQGERAQALHQFRTCTDILRAAFNTTPEPETIALFEQVLRDPAGV